MFNKPFLQNISTTHFVGKQLKDNLLKPNHVTSKSTCYGVRSLSKGKTCMFYKPFCKIDQNTFVEKNNNLNLKSYQNAMK